MKVLFLLFRKNKISNMITKGTRQSSRIIINNNKGASDRYINRLIYERINNTNFIYDIEEIWLYEKGTIRLLFKKTVGRSTPPANAEPQHC